MVPPVVCAVVMAALLAAGWLGLPRQWFDPTLHTLVFVVPGLGWISTFIRLIAWGTHDARYRRLIWAAIGLIASPLLSLTLMLAVLLVVLLITGFPSV